MVDSLPEPAEIARRLLDQEMGDPLDPVGIAEAGESVCRKLRGQFAPLIGPVGFQSVVNHALRQKVPLFPLLGQVQASTGDEPCLKGFAERAQGSESVRVLEALRALLAGSLELLLSLLGQDLCLNLLREVLPDL